MLRIVYKPLQFSFLALSRVLSQLTFSFHQALGFVALGLFCLILSSTVLAEEVTLAWESTQNPNLAGYKLYYGYAPGSYDGVLDVGQETTYTLTDLEEGQAYYFALVAYDVHGEESELSKEVAHNGPANDPEEGTDESALPNQDEIDQVESENEPGLEVVEEMAGEVQDTMPAIEQDSKDDQDDNHSKVRGGLYVIPQAQFRIVSVDSEPLVGNGAAESAIDGRVETYWQTEIGAKAPVHPHELVINLGGEYVVRGVRYLPRQDGKMDGMVARYSVYVSEDGANWGKAVITGTFSRDAAEQEVTFAATMGSFVRFVAHSEVQGKAWTSVAELNVLEGR
jgi:hypothetical protein